MCQLKGVLAAALTFFLGVAIYSVFLNFEVDKSKSLVKPAKYSTLPVRSLCEVTRNHELYEKDDVRLRVYLSGRDNLGYWVTEHKKGCGFYMTRVQFWLEEESKAETENLFKELTAKNSEGLSAGAEVEIVGELHTEKVFAACLHYPFGLRNFSLKAKKIKQLSPVEQEPSGDYHGDDVRR